MMRSSIPSTAILPPAMLGILGGGQLGMLFTLAAQSLGYRVTVLDPSPVSPAARFADVHICQAFDHPQALPTLSHTCQAVTTEFEHVNAEAMRQLATAIAVHPSGNCIAIAQDRIAEKQFIQQIGLRTAPFLVIADASVLQTDLTPYLPGILKTARLGYDGKGQTVVNTPEAAIAAHAAYQYQPCIVEKKLALKTEISITLTRTRAGEIALFPPAENQHVNGILNMSIIPARVNHTIVDQATQMAITLANHLAYIGVLAVEFFVLDDDSIVINEIAPRPHNSAHFTLDATLSSQFEQQVRALCGLSPGETTLLKPCVMVNLLGEHWQQGEPDWTAVLNSANAKLHLYGKQEARPGRKMGHYTVLHDNVELALAQAKAIKETL